MLSDKIKLSYKILKSGDYKKINNLLRNIYSFSIEPVKVSNKPLIVQIEPTTYCNLKCIMCVSSDLTRERMNLSLDQFKVLLSEFEYLEKINLVGVGEPLLNPDLCEIIKIAKEKQIKIGIATNGILLDSDKAKQLLDAGISWINISIDGANSKSYKSIRGDDKFNAIVKNAENFQRLLEDYKYAESAVWFTIQGENMRELPKMINLVKSIGFKRLFSQTTHSWGDECISLRKGYMLNGNRDLLLNLIKETERLARIEKVCYTSFNVPGNNDVRLCKWPWRSCYISVEGFVTPCCLNGCNPQIINFGNIYSEKFENIWNGTGYREFRQRLKSSRPPKVCKACPGY